MRTFQRESTDLSLEAKAPPKWEEGHYAGYPAETITWLYRNRDVVRHIIESVPKPVVVTLEDFATCKTTNGVSRTNKVTRK